MAKLEPVSEHTEACWATPECTVCGLRKKPWGRDVPMAAANGMCGSNCEGYAQDPQPGHFWPDEEPERCQDCGNTPESGACFHCKMD